MASLTQAQLQTLRTAIDAETDPAFVADRVAGNTGLMADWFNVEASPAHVVWRTSVPVAEYRDALVWTEVDALTGGKPRIWEWLTGNLTLPLETGKTAVRQGLADCWAANSQTRPALIAVSKRNATRGEKLFATGTGSNADPATLVLEGAITDANVVAALRL